MLQVVSVMDIRKRAQLASSNTMHLVLNEEVNQRHQSRKEGASEELAELQGCWVSWAQSQGTDRPRQRCYQVGDHEDIVPVVIVG